MCVFDGQERTEMEASFVKISLEIICVSFFFISLHAIVAS
jgi:hypothetical protein